MEDNSGRPSNDMLIHETQETMDLEQKSKCSKKNQNNNISSSDISSSLCNCHRIIFRIKR